MLALKTAKTRAAKFSVSPVIHWAIKMLKEEQAAALLIRCEELTGQRLNQTRGNLRNAETRSSAIWELLVIEECSRIGKIKYEPLEGGSPDILLELTNNNKIWVEAAFLHHRFWKEEQLTRAVEQWIANEALRRGISQ